MEGTFLYLLLYLLKQYGIVLFYPIVQQGFVVAEHKAGIFLYDFHRGAEGGNGLGAAFLPAPEPDRVQMGIADQMNMLHKTLRISKK
jgi:hypothetical protein